MNEMLDVQATAHIYAEEAVTLARKEFEVELDYSLKSLEEADAILAAIHRAIPRDERGNPVPQGALSRWLNEVAVFWGAYVGEIIIYHWGGEWIASFSDTFQETIALRVENLTIYPISKVYHRLLEGDQHHLVNFYEEVIWRLNQTLEPIPWEDVVPPAIAG